MSWIHHIVALGSGVSVTLETVAFLQEDAFRPLWITGGSIGIFVTLFGALAGFITRSPDAFKDLVIFGAHIPFATLAGLLALVHGDMGYMIVGVIFMTLFAMIPLPLVFMRLITRLPSSIPRLVGWCGGVILYCVGTMTSYLANSSFYFTWMGPLGFFVACGSFYLDLYLQSRKKPEQIQTLKPTYGSTI